MRNHGRVGVAVIAVQLATLILATGARGQSRSDSLPPGVTPAMVAKGKSLFAGAGLCIACHGMDGKGSIGPDLTDTVWVHHQGGFEEIAAQVLAGIPQEKSASGNIMPPRGGSSLSDAEVRAVAAYVWALSRRKGK